MNKWILLVTWAVLYFVPFSVLAYEMPEQISRGGSAWRYGGEKNVTGPDALDDYNKALALENKLEKELNGFMRIDNGAQKMNVDTRELSHDLCSIATQSNDRTDALLHLQKNEPVLRDLQTVAMREVTYYQHAAKKSLAAVDAYAKAGSKVTDRRAKLADAALDIKSDSKIKAAHTVEAADIQAETVLSESDEILRFDDNVKKTLKEAHDATSRIIAAANELSEGIKKGNIQLTSDIMDSLATLLGKTEQTNAHIMEILSSEYDSYLDLCDAALELKEKNLTKMDALRNYFEASVEAVTEMEAYSYVAALQRVVSVNPRERAATKQLIEEMAAVSVAEKNAANDARKAKETLQAEDAMNDHFRILLANWQKSLSKERMKKEALTRESDALSAGFGSFTKMTEELVASKREDFFAAREATDKAYLIAFGHERMRPVAEREEISFMKPEPLAFAKRDREVENHVYAPVSVLKGEPAGYGAYTYVLFGQRVSKAPTHVRKRYDALLDAIYASTMRFDKIIAPIPQNKLNIFCIPIKKSYISDEAPTAEFYDADLSLSYLAMAGSGAMLKKDIIKRIGLSPGPFLLTLRTPLGKGSSQQQLLFADLSGYPSEGFSSIVAEYKATVVEMPPLGQIVWNPPAAQRLIYTAMTVSDAAPSLAGYIKKIVDFFVPSAQASTVSKAGR